jgi:hypothetical protein
VVESVKELLGIRRLGERKGKRKSRHRELKQKVSKAMSKDDSWNFKSDSDADKEASHIFQIDIYFKSCQGKM